MNPLCASCGAFIPQLVFCGSCGHLEASHDVNARGARTSCSVSSGAKAVRCPCTGWTAPAERAS